MKGKKSALALWPLAQVVYRMYRTIGFFHPIKCYQIDNKSKKLSFSSFSFDIFTMFCYFAAFNFGSLEKDDRTVLPKGEVTEDH